MNPNAAVQSGPVTRDLLAAVSRSFYLSLRVLPAPVRNPLSVTYLLARATDSIADSAAQPNLDRLLLLTQFKDALASPNPPDSFFKAAAACAHAVSHPGERILLQRLPDCFKACAALPADQHALALSVLSHIIHGQSLDLSRFPDAATTRALPDAAALEEYTWLVAGCVGEFWTATCSVAIPTFASLPLADMITLGTRYGKGLQLVNILRDLPGDLAQGRCYLPADQLAAAGLSSLAWPAPDWQPWHAVRRSWLVTARTWLDSGRDYVRHLNSVRLRFAALLPLLIGSETLDLLDAQSDLAPPAAAKISRPRVKALMRRALWLSLRPSRL